MKLLYLAINQLLIVSFQGSADIKATEEENATEL